MTPNTILIDPRAGSAPLEPILRALHAPCRMQQLQYGDFAWVGHGARGEVSVGVEYKRLRDALGCMTGGRFAGHQLPGLLAHYDYSYLIVEGIWRAHPETGILEEAVHGGWRRVVLGQRPFQGRDLDNWLLSMMTLTPLKVRTTDHQRATADMLRSMYHWWQKKWEDHTSLHVIYTPPPATAFVFKPQLAQRVAAQFRHIGWERSAAVADKFRTPLNMALASQSDWATIPGIGDVISSSVVRQWLGEEE